MLGWRRFWARPLPNPASKAAGIGLLLFSLPMLLSLAFGRRQLYGEEAETGGIVGRALADAFRGRIGTTGAVLVAATFVLLAVPLATQVSLGDVFLKLRVRFAGLASRLTVGWARQRDRRTKERLRRTVVTKHLERARKGEISLDDIPFAAEDAPPIVRELPGPGKFSIRKTTVVAAPTPARAKPSGPPAPKKKREGRPAEPAADGLRLHLSARVAAREAAASRASTGGPSPRRAGRSPRSAPSSTWKGRSPSITPGPSSRRTSSSRRRASRSTRS